MMSDMLDITAMYKERNRAEAKARAWKTPEAIAEYKALLFDHYMDGMLSREAWADRVKGIERMERGYGS